MKKIAKLFTCFALTLAIGFSVSACGESSDTSKDEAKAGVEKLKLTKENPVIVDKEAKSVTVLAKVNGKYMTEGTRHALVFSEGGFGDKPVFISLLDQNTFYDKLIEIGAVPGNNMTLDNAMTTQVEGDKLLVNVTWDGTDKVYDINEVIKDSNDKKIDMRFGGNQQNAKEKNTGCLACLDSCPVGVVSNHTYKNGAVEKTGEVKFTGNADLLPEDGTYVAIKFTLATAASADCCSK